MTDFFLKRKRSLMRENLDFLIKKCINCNFHFEFQYHKIKVVGLTAYSRRHFGEPR